MRAKVYQSLDLGAADEAFSSEARGDRADPVRPKPGPLIHHDSAEIA